MKPTDTVEVPLPRVPTDPLRRPLPTVTHLDRCSYLPCPLLQVANSLVDDTLMDIGEWMTFLDHMGLFDSSRTGKSLLNR